MAKNVNSILAGLIEEKATGIKNLHNTIVKNLPKGFEIYIANNMINYVVPHTIYKNGYHCNPKQPLPFLSIAAQKNFIALYHMGIYADPVILNWFVYEYPLHVKSKLDMGKSCVRFKKIKEIPYKLIESLVKKISVKDWIKLYEEKLKLMK